MVKKKDLLISFLSSQLKGVIDNIKYEISYCILAKIGLSHFKIVVLLALLL